MPGNPFRMWTTFMTIVPTGLVLGLIAFGTYGGRPRPVPTKARIAATAVASVVIGPVVAAAVGFFLWMTLVAAGAAALTMVALLRTPPPPHHHGRVAHR